MAKMPQAKFSNAKVKIYVAIFWAFPRFLGGWEVPGPSVSSAGFFPRFLVETLGAAEEALGAAEVLGAGATFAFGAAFGLTIFKALQIGFR